MSRRLQFKRWDVQGYVAASVLFPPGPPLCGVYVIEFGDGSEYVGQTVNLASRYASHCRRWAGQIVGLRFADTPAEDLDDVECDVIAQRRAEGVELRNIRLVDMPMSSAALDLVVDREVQHEWLRGEVEPLNIGDRGRIARQRRKTAARHEKLRSREDYPELLNALADYVGKVLPWPHQTEGRFWVVTSLPSTGRSSTWRRLSVISVNNVETLVLGEWRDESGDLFQSGFINLAWDTQLPEEVMEIAAPGHYATVGDVWRLEFWDHTEALVCLNCDEIAAGARRLAMGLLRKGKGMLTRHHDYNLADDIFAALEDQMPPGA